MRAALCSQGPPDTHPEATNQGGQVGGGWGAVVSVEEEAVAVSLGCYLSACFESPAASCTPSHSH